MQETNSSAQTFFLPIVILVVIQLANVAREAKVDKSVGEEHPPLLISSLINMIFSVFRWIVVGIAGAIILKLISDSFQADQGSWLGQVRVSKLVR